MCTGFASNGCTKFNDDVVEMGIYMTLHVGT